jgi:dephospho-CoA kinase
MRRAALTGNIGCGKTTVSKVFAFLGVPVYNADEHARTFLLGENVNASLIIAFGNDIMDEKGLPDRMKLAGMVFNDNAALKKLNAIIHPLVMKDFDEWTKQHESCPYVILESAIIFENKLEKYFDRVIMVSAPEEERIQRVMKRDGVTREKVIERIKNQMPEETKVALSDFVIINDDRILAVPQIMDIHHVLSLRSQN